MDKIERQPLPAPGAQPITENDGQWLHGAIGRALKDVLSGPQSYYSDGVQEDSQDMGADLDRFITSLENFRNNYVIDPSEVMGPMVDQLKERVKEFKKFHEDQPSDSINRQPPDTRDNRWIEVAPFPGPSSPPLPWSPSQRPKFRDASTPLPDDTGGQFGHSTTVAVPRFSVRVPNTASVGSAVIENPTAPANVAPLPGIYSGKPMKQWIVPPQIWRSR